MIGTRAEVRRVLFDWEAGRVSATEVHGWAEERYAVSNSEPEDAVVNEVLARLDMLDVDLLVAADVPALKRLLESHPSRLPEALTEYEAYVGAVDVPRRQRELAGDPLYRPFCKLGGVPGASL